MAEMLVKDWMTPHVVSISASCKLPEAYWLMLENNIRRLPVVDGGYLVGMVTLEDLRRMEPARIAGFDLIYINKMLSELPIRQLMTENPITISPTAPLTNAAQVMLQNKISSLPVLDGDNLVGIITESDIFRAFVETYASD
jgi:acetoin utilization protein AcuB